MKKPAPPTRLSARERLLAAAESLFYAEGFNTVGIDRVIERAGVAKASLYDCFGSKDELIKAYLLSRQEARQVRFTKGLTAYKCPRDRLLGVFDILGRLFAESSFRGCPFVKAGADAQPGSSVKTVCDSSRRWLLNLFTQLSMDAGARDPQKLARQLVILYDGASISAQLDHSNKAAAAARIVAATMLDADSATQPPVSTTPVIHSRKVSHDQSVRLPANR